MRMDGRRKSSYLQTIQIFAFVTGEELKGESPALTIYDEESDYVLRSF
jgi:hypothetical protein